MGSAFHELDFRFFVIEISGFQSQRHSRFLELCSGFQSPRFRIPQAKISWNVHSTGKNFLDSEILIPLFYGAMICLKLKHFRLGDYFINSHDSVGKICNWCVKCFYSQKEATSENLRWFSF